jgi:hypothetical protein
VAESSSDFPQHLSLCPSEAVGEATAWNILTSSTSASILKHRGRTRIPPLLLYYLAKRKGRSKGYSRFKK